MYKYETIIRMRDTDAMGVVYFVNFFDLAHQSYESYFEQENSLGEIIAKKEFIIPIVNAQGDFLKPLMLSEKIVIKMTLGKMGNSSFELAYDLINEASEIAGQIRTTHVVLSHETRNTVDIPQFIKDVLERI